MHRLIRNIGWLLTGRGVNAVLSIVYLALATRTLGLDHFGYFAIILALGQTVTGLANFQTWQFVVRWGVGEDGPGDATGFAIALDMLSVALGLVLTTNFLVWEDRSLLFGKSEFFSLRRTNSFVLERTICF